MSDSDRAFIRAFAERSPSKARLRDRSVAEERPNDPRPLVSQFFSAATVSIAGPEPTEREQTTKPPVTVATRTPAPPHRGKGRVRHFTLDAEEPSARTASQLRRDEANLAAPADPANAAPSVAAPHFSVDNLKPTATTCAEPRRPQLGNTTFRLDAVPSEPSLPVNSPPFRPQWEVDHFAFPPICEELHEKSAAGLAELLRAVLTRAWRGKNIVAFTSFGHSEGTSTVAMCIARLAASFSARVALLDGNTEHPTLAEALDLDVPTSWPDSSPDVPLGEAAIGSADERMVVLPLVAEDTEAWKSAVRRRAGSVLASLKEAFDLVVVDAGPIYQAAHLWFRTNEDPIIHTATVVRDLRRTANIQLEDVCLRLQQAGIPDVAIVDNFRAPVESPGTSARCMSDTGI